jgi:predicted RNase H-related nuclease YkuK (DUF458 family)
MSKVSLNMLAWHDANSNATGLGDIFERIKNKKPSSEIHVGCDSHFIKDKCIFAVVIAIYEPRKGGTYFFTRSKVHRSCFLNMKVRLLKETELALQVADMVSSLLDRDKMFVHLDINPNKKYKSHQVFTSATSWVQSQGYQCVVKPDSWASSWLADAYAK